MKSEIKGARARPNKKQSEVFKINSAISPGGIKPKRGESQFLNLGDLTQKMTASKQGTKRKDTAINVAVQSVNVKRKESRVLSPTHAKRKDNKLTSSIAVPTRYNTFQSIDEASELLNYDEEYLEKIEKCDSKPHSRNGRAASNCLDHNNDKAQAQTTMTSPRSKMSMNNEFPYSHSRIKIADKPQDVVSPKSRTRRVHSKTK